MTDELQRELKQRRPTCVKQGPAAVALYNPRMTELTLKQQAILAFIKSFTFITPTIREIAKHFKIHNSTAQGHLEALRKKGFL